MQNSESVRREYLAMIQRYKENIIAKESAYNQETIRFLWQELDRLEDKILSAEDGMKAIELFWDMYIGEFMIREAGLFNRDIDDKDFAYAKARWQSVHTDATTDD